jgi:hypothetical protein
MGERLAGMDKEREGRATFRHDKRTPPQEIATSNRQRAIISNATSNNNATPSQRKSRVRLTGNVKAVGIGRVGNWASCSHLDIIYAMQPRIAWANQAVKVCCYAQKVPPPLFGGARPFL